MLYGLFKRVSDGYERLHSDHSFEMTPEQATIVSDNLDNSLVLIAEGEIGVLDEHRLWPKN